MPYMDENLKKEWQLSFVIEFVPLLNSLLLNSNKVGLAQNVANVMW